VFNAHGAGIKTSRNSQKHWENNLLPGKIYIMNYEIATFPSVARVYESAAAGVEGDGIRP